MTPQAGMAVLRATPEGWRLAPKARRHNPAASEQNHLAENTANIYGGILGGIRENRTEEKKMVGGILGKFDIPLDLNSM